jgi:signal transduction histidine kinase/CheY-like chemotaxis protein
MQSTPQESGRSVASSLATLRTHDHVCLIYESDDDQRRAILPFLEHGLARNERCLCIADSATVSAVGAALRGGGIDVDGASSRGALAIATEREAYLAGGRFDPDAMIALGAGASQQAVSDGYAALRIAGEMRWALGGDPGSDRIMEYEVKVNERLPSMPCLALCQYDRRRFGPEVIRDVIRTHPLVIVNGRVCRNFYYVPPGELTGADRLQHEVDRLLENILERERAEDALRESERRLALTARLASVGTLAAGVAHEINNPLAFVTANLGWLDEQLAAATPARLDAARARLREALAEAISGAERIRDVVQGLRRFARPSEDGPRERVDLRRELETAIGIARHQVGPRAQLRIAIPDTLPAVEAKQHEVGQVVVNLLVNAAQAIPEGRAAEHEVRVSAGAEGGRVVIEVADTGCGIPPEVLPRIFDPFFTTRAASGGTGLGLAISHGIVTGMGGTVAVESVVGRGTTFRVTLPVGATPAEEPRPPQRVAAPGRRRVLVIDDEPSMGRAIERVLGGEHDVEVLTSAGEAARRLEAGERWDLILCDLVMPDVTGMELAARLAARAPDVLVRVVFMTGGAYTDGSRDFLASGGHRWVEKPVSPEVLRALAAGGRKP